jgi:hypothetical protein
MTQSEIEPPRSSGKRAIATLEVYHPITVAPLADCENHNGQRAQSESVAANLCDCVARSEGAIHAARFETRAHTLKRAAQAARENAITLS